MRRLLHAAAPYRTPFLVAALAIAAGAGGDAARLLLRWDRIGLAAGEWWRVLSGNLVHLGTSHLVLNVTGLALVWALVGGALQGWRGPAVLAAAGCAVGLGLWWGEPDLFWYVGLSGCLHGLLVAGALLSLSRRRGESLLLLVLVALKLAWEIAVGPMAGTAALAGGPVITASHLYGACGGFLAGLLLVWRDRRASSVPV